MKKNTKPMKTVFLLFTTVLIGSNICCTGIASNKENDTTGSSDKNTPVTTASGTKSITTLTESTFDESTKTGLVLVDFSATWCGPCRIQSPILEEVRTEMKEKATLYKLDVDQSPLIANRFNVQNIPTILIFKDGKVTELFVGLTQKSDIISAIEKFSAKK